MSGTGKEYAEMKTEMIVREMWRKTYNIVEYGNNLFR